MENRVKMHLDAETIRIRRASLKVTIFCKFEADSKAFTKGLRSVLKELRSV